MLTLIFSLANTDKISKKIRHKQITIVAKCSDYIKIFSTLITKLVVI